MKYQIDIKPACIKSIRKLSKNNPILRKVLEKKMNEIAQNPYHFKHLKYSREWRVHILKSYVLKFEVDENNKIITFLLLAHHDNAYKY